MLRFELMVSKCLVYFVTMSGLLAQLFNLNLMSSSAKDYDGRVCLHSSFIGFHPAPSPKPKHTHTHFLPLFALCAKMAAVQQLTTSFKTVCSETCGSCHGGYVHPCILTMFLPLCIFQGFEWMIEIDRWRLCVFVYWLYTERDTARILRSHKWDTCFLLHHISVAKTGGVV